jgi:protein ImuB
VLALCAPDLPLQRLRRGRDGGRGAIAVACEGRVVCCDGGALRAGVRPGMALPEALAACGALEVSLQDPGADVAALRALAEAMLAIAPQVEVAPPDVLLLDAGAAHVLARPGMAPGDEERALAERARAIAAEMGWMVRAAVASGRAPARALARHGDALVLRTEPGGAPRALAPLPLAALELPSEVAGRLAALGVLDVGGVARLPPESLAHRFGAAGVAAALLARGLDDSPIAPYLPETLPEEGLELEGPVESAEPLLFALKRLADRIAARLAGRGLGATRLRIVLGLDPRGEERLVVPLAQPTASAARWLVPAKEQLFAVRLPGAVVRVRLAAIEVAAAAAEQLALGDRPEALAALETVLSRLAVRLGDDALFAAEPVERHRPEAAYRPERFRPAEARRRAVRHAEAVAARSAAERALSTPIPTAIPTATAAPRPRRRARRGDAAALVPPMAAEDPAPYRPTRLLPSPRSIVAEGEGGRLTAIHVGARAHAVLAIEGPERLSGEWWSSPYQRDYYRIRLEGLGDCWIYRDAADGRLYLHGFFD